VKIRQYLRVKLNQARTPRSNKFIKRLESYQFGQHMDRLIAILLTGGEAHDCPVAERLIRRVQRPKRMLGDKAYDSAELREELDEHGTKSVIPNRSNRKQPFCFSKRLYKLRWRIEAAFNRLKDFRRIATRYDRLARNYLASVCLAAALVWWI
jgi:transposase